MRFLFYDRILETDPGQRALGRLLVSVQGEYFSDHFRRAPLMPATLVIEALAQVAGWLNFTLHGESVRMVVALVEEVTIHRQVGSGEVLDLEVWLLRRHVNGVTMRCQARVGDEPIATVERMVFANQSIAASDFSEREMEHFHYVSGLSNARGGSRP
jgi:3-hydroxyacyl-[acyl-carrier-protein] dehydratase